MVPWQRFEYTRPWPLQHPPVQVNSYEGEARCAPKGSESVFLSETRSSLLFSLCRPGPNRSLNYLFTNDELSCSLGFCVANNLPPPPRFSLLAYLLLFLFTSPHFPSLLTDHDGTSTFRVPRDSNLQQWIRNNSWIGLCKGQINICFPWFRGKTYYSWQQGWLVVNFQGIRLRIGWALRGTEFRSMAENSVAENGI